MTRMLLEIYLEKQAAEEMLFDTSIPFRQRLALARRLDELNEERLEKVAGLREKILAGIVPFVALGSLSNNDGTMNPPTAIFDCLGGMDENLGKKRKEEDDDEDSNALIPFGPSPPLPPTQRKKPAKKNNGRNNLII